MAEAIRRAMLSFLLHLALAGVMFGLMIWITSGFNDASEELRTQYSEEAVVLALLGDARWQLLYASLGSLVVSWLCSALFISIAENKSPHGDREAAGLFPLWAGLLFVVLTLAALMWWNQVVLADIVRLIASGHFVLAIIATTLSLLIGYWAGTGLFVKSPMRLSVPLARLFRR
jgi:hypothetical protein